MSVNLNRWVAAICVSVVILLMQVIVTQYSMISELNNELRLVHVANRLEHEQMTDLTYELERVRSESTAVGLQQFVAGIVSAVDHKDQYTEVWHDGYNRGAAVAQYAAKLDAEQEKKNTAYTNSPRD
jgi:hypothetical protein